jgi:hypothetical protein
VPFAFRNSFKKMLRCITNFGKRALVLITSPAASQPRRAWSTPSAFRLSSTVWADWGWASLRVRRQKSDRAVERQPAGIGREHQLVFVR